MNFDTAGFASLHPALEYAIEKAGFKQATAIQIKAYPQILKGHFYYEPNSTSFPCTYFYNYRC